MRGETQVSPTLKWQEVTMQIRHIRPGSLEWQDAKGEVIDPGFERLTPEETIRLRKLSDDLRRARKDEERGRMELQ
jgi:hypothetical protein